MFLGLYRHNVDNKARLTVPARYRDLLDDGAFLVRGLDKTLMVMTTKAFEVVSMRLNRMSLTDPLARSLRRRFMGSASRVEIDKVGRILLPEFLCETVGIGCEQEVVLVGQGDYFEIWSSEEWALQQKSLDDEEANTERFKVLDLSTSTE